MRLLAALCAITAVVWMNVACPANVSVPIDLVLGLPVAAAILGWAISEWLA